MFLFVTANKHEREAFEEKFIRHQERFLLGKTYYIGEFGHYPSAYIHIYRQGINNPESVRLVGELVRELDPAAVIMVGIAFGVNETEQKIGDVLVSDMILPYDDVKLRESNTEYKEIPREVGFRLLNAFREHKEWEFMLPNLNRANVHVGALLTGSCLIDRYEFRERLLNDFKDRNPIGGEMEAFGIYRETRIFGVSEWIIVKGICDWAYDKSNPNKENDQKTAAHASVDYCYQVFSRDGVFNDFGSNKRDDNFSLIPIAKRAKQPINLSGFFMSHVPAKEFINRDRPRELFYSVLNSEAPFKQNVIMYYGIGGIGKSSLARNLREYTKKQNVLYASVDFDDPALRSPYKALISLEEKLKITLPHFDIAVTLCFVKRNPEFSFWDSGLPNAMSREVLKLLKSSGSTLLYNATSGLTELIYRKFFITLQLDESVKEQLIALEEQSAAYIEEQLSVFFAVDIYRHMVIEELDKCVLFFDTYELLWEKGRGIENKLRNDTWIRTLADRLKNVLFVLSGREKLQWELENEMWVDRIQIVPLDVLEPEHARQYLSVCKIEAEAIQNSIIRAAQGHPYYLDLCVDTYYKLLDASKPVTTDSFGGGFQEILERFFRSLDKSEISVLRVLSVPRFYDFEVFEILNSRFRTGYSTASFDVFNAFSFIKHEQNSKYIIHILMRDEIKKQLNKELKRSIDNSMVNYYREKLAPKKIPVVDIRFYFSELLYHLFASESQEHILSRVEAEYIGIVKRLQVSGETKYLLEQFLGLFNTNKSSLGGSEFFAVMTDMIHLSGKYREAVGLMTEYLSGFPIDEIASNGYKLNLYIRSTHHQMFYMPLQSLYNDLNSIIDLVNRNEFMSQYCEILFMIGAHISLPMGDFENTRNTLRRMNNLARKHCLNGLLCRGLRKYSEMLCACGYYSRAEKICLAAIHIATDNALWRYKFYLRCILGEIKRLSSKTYEASKQFNEVMSTAMSLGIKGWVGHINLALGNCYTDLGDYESAFLRFENARKIYSEIGQKWGELNLETAYQRALLLSAGSANKSILERLKQESDSLGYSVLSCKIDGLISGDKSIIRFEYL